ncbi:MAG TPA: SsrA-binding protein SmpB [Candidatus Hydrothermia bacterium]|nr:SsrA-binding protein SmpB [Candidatus Hydrothermae bacterium]MDD3649813.1 SsrA-binding protein SmpB [Candidatus Hydrothermia bacterium]MDD5572458.1 SsrA-binding protein SmpB [Candidatus Hydrothermia bacterium]HOK23395.1 SsrA-binding protein SmpB [Candidatus Hydrothermia bacterium]HOL24205.1 SsrA-binding protein SmpB [Candidatus Hydrothermia bacterium]
MNKHPERIIVKNQKAYHDFEILETYEAGIVLKGSEVKSVKEGKVSLKEAYADIRNGEVYIINMHITPYEKDRISKLNPLRPRKLLLHKYEIKRLIGKVKERGFTLIPLMVVEKRNLIKVVLGLGRGKKLYEKREELKKRIVEREIQRAMKREME